MTHYLVVTAIGTDRPGIVNEVTRHVSGCGCNIVDSRLGIFGNEFTFIMLLSGDWNSLMQLEISLPLRSQEWDLITMMKRTERHHSLQYDISASAEVLIRDQPGIVSQCTQFFSDHGWDIQAMQLSLIHIYLLHLVVFSPFLAQTGYQYGAMNSCPSRIQLLINVTLRLG